VTPTAHIFATASSHGSC